MNCEFDVAASIANDWRDRSTLLVLFLVHGVVKVEAMTLLLEFSKTGVVLESTMSVAEGVEEPIFRLSLPFDESVSFGYAEPRETEPEHRDRAEAEFVCSLTINKPKTKTNEEITLVLTETRIDHQADSDSSQVH